MMLEPPALSESHLWIFTTTRAGEKDLLDCQLDAHPLLSRCLEISLTSRNLCPAFAKRCVEIAELEGLVNGMPESEMIKKVERVLKDKGNNFRDALWAIETGLLL